MVYRTRLFIGFVTVMLGLTVAARLYRPIDRPISRTVLTGTRIDLNSAGVPMLCLLPGIGPQLGQRIVANREQVGPFLRVDELQRVSGIGPKTVAKIRQFVACHTHSD